MISDLKPYPAYKDSGLLWLEEVPEHWNLIPNRALIKKRKILVGDRYTEYRLLSLTKEGVIVRDVESGKGKFSADMGTSQEVRAGDLIFCFFDIPETPRTVGLSHHNGMITSAYAVFECSDPVLSAFLELFYKAMDDQKLLSPLYSGLRNTIPPLRFLGIKTPVPTHDEQLAIVRFLDYMDRRIRRYISVKQKLIALLEEQKQAIIHRAVTRGLDPSVPLKPSGVEWLGDVPEHWSVLKFKRLVNHFNGIQMGPFGSSLTHLQEYDTGFKLYGQENTISGNFHIGTRWLTKSQFYELQRYKIHAGDLVLTRKGSIGKCRIVPNDAPIGIADSDTIRVKVNEKKVSRQFIVILLHYAPYVQFQIHSIQRGAVLGGLNTTTIAELQIAVPPISEQNVLVEQIEHWITRSDHAIATVSCEIDFLREYRARLISDVVTGKLDVRGIDLPATEDTETPEEYTNLLQCEEVMEDEEPKELLAEGD